MQRLARDTNSFYFDPDAAPALTIASGDTVVVETQDAHCGTITGPDVVYKTLDEVMERIGGANPVTGPIAIDGVSPGDLLAIEVLDVVGAPERGYGYMTTTPTLDLRSKRKRRSATAAATSWRSQPIGDLSAFRTGRSSERWAWHRPARRCKRSCSATTCSATSTFQSCAPDAPSC